MILFKRRKQKQIIEMSDLMRVDVMVDIETLGKEADSTIIQIAAVAFNMEDGKHLSQFNQIVDIEKETTMNTDGSTIKWWVNTNKELLQELLNKGEHSSEDVLTNFHKWLIGLGKTEDTYLWGNGILFDNKMIQHQMNSLGIGYPIFYKNDRDVRTLVDLAGKKLGISERNLKGMFNSDAYVEHDAIDDVKCQIDLVVGCYKALYQ